jgi:hypothetical protein
MEEGVDKVGGGGELKEAFYKSDYDVTALLSITTNLIV